MGFSMHADELRSAISRVVEVLNKADILAVVKEYRTAKGDNRAVAAARLGHSGAIIMESMENFSAAEKAVVKCMFLESLGTTQYWQGLLASAADPEKNSAELVHLFSRAMLMLVNGRLIQIVLLVLLTVSICFIQPAPVSRESRQWICVLTALTV